MANSDVQIVNIALTGIGSARILRLTDDQETARKCNAVYTPIRDEVLASYPWKFALQRAQLAKLSDAPLFGYANAFQIPSDCLRIVATDLDEDGYKWSREGETLVTDEGTIKIQYIKRITDPTKFSPAFVTALSARLEAELAYPCTSSADLAKQKLEVYFKSKLPMAKSLDAQEGGEGQLLASDAWVDARRNGQI
jgi:hypothetical protein